MSSITASNMKQHTKEELDTVSKSVSAVIFADFQLYLQEVTSAPKSDTMMKPTAQDLAAYLESLRNEEQRQQLMRFFKTGKGDYANNWGLVDLSAPRIIGRWLTLPTRLGNRQEMVDGLAASGNLWRERISMVCTWMTTRMGEPSWCLRYAEMHLHHKHDLMHKAVGWMLRELGKQVDMDLLREFLKQHVHEMSRTTLRYAIEKMPDEERKYWMRL